MAGNLMQPLRSAIALGSRAPALVAFGVALATHTIVRAVQVQAFEAADPAPWLNLLLYLGPVAMSAILIIFLARTLLIDAHGYGRPLIGRFAGLYLLAVILFEFVGFAGSIAIFSAGPSPLLLLYGSPVVSGLASAAAFPLFVRCFATAAGIEEPRLSTVWAFVFGGGRAVYFWYALSAIGLNLLSAFTFANLLPAGEGNSLPGNLVQSFISATAQILRCLLDVVAVRMLVSGWQEDVEVFA
jgi:hypothetical protein